MAGSKSNSNKEIVDSRFCPSVQLRKSSLLTGIY